MKTSLSGREPLNGLAESGSDLLEIDVLDVAESVRAKNRFNASRLETAGPAFTNLLEVFGPLRDQFPHLFCECLRGLHVVEHDLRVRDRRHVVQSAADSVLCQIRHDAEPGEKRGRVRLKACADERLPQTVPLEIDRHESQPWRKGELSFSQLLAFPCLRCGVVHLIDTDLSCAMGTSQSERVESGAEDDDLPHPSFDSSRQRIFRNSASCGGEQTSNAGHGMCVRKLQHVLFVFVQNLHGKWVIEDRPMIEHLMGSSLSCDEQGCAAGVMWLHVRGLHSVQ